MAGYNIRVYSHTQQILFDYQIEPILKSPLRKGDKPTGQNRTRGDNLSKVIMTKCEVSCNLILH